MDEPSVCLSKVLKLDTLEEKARIKRAFLRSSVV